MIKRVLFVHNVYREFGGEESVLRQLRETLESHGWATDLFERRSGDYEEASAFQKIRLASQIPFSWDVFYALQRRITETSPSLVHLHNIFPFITPSVYSAARRAGLPVVQTLHNYRLLCVNGLFLRDGRPCERCLGGNVLHAVAGRCHGGSLPQSIMMASSLFLHRHRKTWHRGVAAFVALSQFSKGKFVEGGLPEEKIHVIPNFLNMARYPFQSNPGDYILFMGRLAEEKGFRTLLKSFEILSKRMAPPALHVVGDGPLQDYFVRFMESHPELPIRWHGRLEGAEKIDRLKNARLLIFPSECYENCPLTVLESLAVGTPVLASKLGGTQELIRHQETGVFFSAGDAEDLAGAMEGLLSKPARLMAMRSSARQDAEKRFDQRFGIEQLLAVYLKVGRSLSEDRQI